MRPRRILAALALASVAISIAFAAQDKAAPAPLETYPPVRYPSSVHAFSVPDDIKADVVRKSLADLGTKESDCKILYGPMKAGARPSKVFIVVEAPATVDVKDIAKALKKGTPTVETVGWTCFQSSDPTMGRGLGAGGIPGMSPRDWILGMSNDLRWVEARGGFVEFFFTPGKLSADVIADRFHKLVQPFGVKDVGRVVEESFTWTLEEPVDPAAAKRVEKVLAKIPGVKDAKVDPAAKSLHMTVALEDLVRGGPPISLPGLDVALPGANVVKDGDDPPRMRFDTNQIFDALDKEKLVVHVPKKEGEDAKKGG